MTDHTRIGWDDPHNAEWYDDFARKHDLYRDTSHDLVELAALTDVNLVIDLACGTGVTTEAILERVGAGTEVVGIDGSEAMLDIARPESQLAWLRVPVFAQNVLPGMPHEEQLAVLDKAYERFDKTQDGKNLWMVFVARKRTNP